jgi:outer membrane receptor protein involved in Fe transport
LWKPLVGGEHVQGVEGGIKAQLLDRQVVLNTSGYLYDYKGLQTTFYIVALSTAVLGNGADVRAQGLETSVDYMPKEVPGLTLSAMLNYDDTHYSHFVNASCWGLQTLAQGCYTIPGSTAKGQTLTGRTTFLAPEWVGKVTASYKWDLSEKYTAAVSADAQFTSRYYGSSDLEPFSHQNGYALVDASLHLGRSDDSWDLAVLCRNCTNKIYVAYASDGASTTTPAANVNIGHPLQIMVQLTVKPQLF